MGLSKVEYDPEKVLGVACPHCLAPAGEMCKSRTGKVASEIHVRRKGEIYPRFMRGAGGDGKKRGVRKVPLVLFRNLSEKQQSTIMSIAMMKCGSIAIAIPERSKLGVWKTTIELIDMGIVEIFIGKSRIEKGCATFRMRLTAKGKDIWSRANI